MKVAQVKTDPTLIRDVDTQAILNTDNEALAAYKKRKKQSSNLHQRLDVLEEKFDQLINILNERL